MPFLARVADQYGPLRVMVVGLALGVGANLAFATSTGVAGLFLGQLLAAGLWAALGALGVSIAQHLYPEGVGTASGVFLSSMTLGAAAGGLIGGFGVARLGLPEVFYVPAVLSAVALVGLVVLERRLRVPTPAAVREPAVTGRR